MYFPIIVKDSLLSDKQQRRVEISFHLNTTHFTLSKNFHYNSLNLCEKFAKWLTLFGWISDKREKTDVSRQLSYFFSFFFKTKIVTWPIHVMLFLNSSFKPHFILLSWVCPLLVCYCYCLPKQKPIIGCKQDALLNLKKNVFFHFINTLWGVPSVSKERTIHESSAISFPHCVTITATWLTSE